VPELPEVECVRRTVEAAVLGRRVVAVELRRPDVLAPVTPPPSAAPPPVTLLQRRRVVRVVRHGKRLAIVGDDASAVGVHLGMSGRLLALPPGVPASAEPFAGRHTHATWRLDGGGRLAFVDPRRFGGLWDWPAGGDAAAWFAGMGPDALAVGPAALHRGLGGTQRALKAALLDQAVVAGLGNIYVDELLHAARTSPLRPAATLTRPETASLVRRMRGLLGRAIAAGGSSLRDYVDADGRAGGYQTRHHVYGRAGARCSRRGCRTTLRSASIAGRTTVWCPGCQPTVSEMSTPGESDR
jgi:formamidopyrimidine-DNA glycosylase